MTQNKLVELPHGCTLDPATGELNLNLGRVSLQFSLEEWEDFTALVDDVNVVVQTNSVENVMQCPACNTVSRYVHYEEPTEEELN